VDGRVRGGEPLRAGRVGGQLTNEPDRERERARALRRIKRLATALLAFTAALFMVARHFEATHWVWGYVAAFAAAATVGGLADWYAVVALFRRPLGLPIPHTAIIPRNHLRIADTLGTFIETNFLAPEPVEARLREVDFAALVADWLSDRERAAALAEAEGHHPDITFGWGYATVSLRTKKIKGLHENDFIMAAKLDRIAAEKTQETRPER